MSGGVVERNRKGETWKQAIDKLIDDNENLQDDSVEYEYEYEEEDACDKGDEAAAADDDDERRNDHDHSLVKKKQTQLHQTAACDIQVGVDNEADDWDEVPDSPENLKQKSSNDDASTAYSARKKFKQFTLANQEPDTDVASVESSSWSMVTSIDQVNLKGDGREGYSRAGMSSDFSSITTNIGVASVATRNSYVKIDGPHEYSVQSLDSNGITAKAGSTVTSVVSKLYKVDQRGNDIGIPPVPHNLGVPLAALAASMVSCPRCTMENLPGAQTCCACEVPLIANPQIDIDHEIALRLAKIEEEEGTEQDLQSLLLDGTIQPKTAPTPTPKNQTTNITTGSTIPIQQIYKWTNDTLREIKTMEQTLQSQKVCNVVSTIQKEQLVQLLVALCKQRKQTFGDDDLAFGFFVTCQPVEDVWEQGIAGHKLRSSCGDFEKDELDRKKESNRLLFTSSLLSNDERKRSASVHPADSCGGPGIRKALYPSQQLTYEKSLVPDYVWLVLLDTSQLRNKSKKKIFSRQREEDHWSKKGYAGTWNVPATRPVIPLMCTANANFRRPYKPRLRHSDIKATTTSTLVEDADVDQIYHQAYNRMKDGVLKSMTSS